MNRAAQLRARLAQPEILIVPGVVDALTARLAQEAGFPAVYLTGAGLANAQFGLPDLGFLGLAEVAAQTARLADAVEVPLIVDADTGYGNALNVRRTVRELERAGAAAIQLEDQVSPKRCGHFAGKAVISREEMVQKIRAAVEARRDPETVIIARTDALASEGIEGAIARARAYRAAGADILFVEAPRDRDQLARLPREIDAPLLVNQVEGGQTPLLPAKELHRLGFRIALYANTALRVALFAVREAFAVLAADGSSERLVGQMLDWEERQRLAGLEGWLALEQRYAS
ncbi:MAG: oxaloacetate decarboxylase [Chloroflexota bacterium]|nr:oxaloacetate decarboxylase [Dehalococcoidia bacterium]MDW8254013.1 oxaloacetate decarboxylase [Chloroflexota bacterium]